jgi:hypothetical protein
VHCTSKFVSFAVFERAGLTAAIAGLTLGYSIRRTRRKQFRIYIETIPAKLSRLLTELRKNAI